MHDYTSTITVFKTCKIPSQTERHTNSYVRQVPLRLTPLYPKTRLQTNHHRNMAAYSIRQTSQTTIHLQQINDFVCIITSVIMHI